jgi:hypothetical protein
VVFTVIVIRIRPRDGKPHQAIRASLPYAGVLAVWCL